jgi:hypothetical protein
MEIINHRIHSLPVNHQIRKRRKLFRLKVSLREGKVDRNRKITIIMQSLIYQLRKAMASTNLSPK